jgi:predicted NodU family carbamoyl transferase
MEVNHKEENFVLGIHYAHDSTVVLMKNGEILEAMSEERLSRIKKYTGFPYMALNYIQEKYHLKKVSHVVVVGLPEFSLERSDLSIPCLVSFLACLIFFVR